MCGRFTIKMTWAEIVALYRLTLDRPLHNLQPRFNVCPTDPIDVVIEHDGKRDFVRMRWGLVPWWWSKPLAQSFHSFPQPAKVIGLPSVREKYRVLARTKRRLPI